MNKIVIVGGVAGGASAAARLRRLDEHAQIILLERGSYISFANCGLPYHIGNEICDRNALLVQTVEQFSTRFQVDVRIEHEVIALAPDEHQVTVKTPDGVIQIQYDKLLLSPGAQAVIPPIDGIEDPRVMTLRSLPDMDQIIASLDPNCDDPVAILGGGFIGLEVAEALIHRGHRVELIEASPQVMNTVDPEMAVWIHRTLLSHGIQLHLGCALQAVKSTSDYLTLECDAGQEIKAQLLICAVGVKPENKLAKEANLTLGKHGGIAVNAHLQTSHPDIYAVGDAIEVTDWVLQQSILVPLAGPANRQGRLAAENMLTGHRSFRGTQGSSICRVFNLAVGSVGANEKALKRAHINYRKLYIHSNHHAGYYPGAVPIHLKLLYKSDNGEILGAQAIGEQGIDKRIDVISVALQAHMSVYDLEELELSYAPPFGSAKDPLNYAGFVAVNDLSGLSSLVYPEDVAQFNGQIVDVRNPQELVTHGAIEQAINIPLDQLRDRLDELDPKKAVLVTCQVGLRGYIASCILRQHHFDVVNLTGGYCSYKCYLETQQGD